MMNIDFITATVLDGAFAAVAAIGFAIISNPPRKAILISAFLAAVGHGLRYFLMHAHLFTMDIATASFFAAVSIGLLAIPFAKAIHCPAEVFSFPSLLPMIPGMFAYKSILALTKFMQTKDETDSLRYLVDFCHNGSTTIFVLFALVVGAAVPVFIFHRQSFTATRLLKKLVKKDDGIHIIDKYLKWRIGICFYNVPIRHFNYFLASAMYSKASVHFLVTYPQSSAATLSFGNNLDPIPTQNAPAPNHPVRFSRVGSTPPVTINLDQGIGAIKPFTKFGPYTSPGNILQRSQPASCAKPTSETEPHPGV